MFRLSNVFVLFLLGMFIQCEKAVKVDTDQLTGYWEIESVHQNGEVFYPKGNGNSIDYYHLNESMKGWRKKMSPAFNGIYNSSADKALFELKINDKLYRIFYYNALEPWEESIIFLDQNKMILVHNKREHHYKRHHKISL